jgi:hypothetical protein
MARTGLDAIFSLVRNTTERCWFSTLSKVVRPSCFLTFGLYDSFLDETTKKYEGQRYYQNTLGRWMR